MGYSGIASANAANPGPNTGGTATVNGNGSVTVALSGTWDWPNQPCSGRYGEGFAVDWWGMSASSTPTNNFQLTNATEVTTPGTTTTGNTVSFAGSIPVSGGEYFHVGQYYSGETVNSSSTCTDTTTTTSGGGGPGGGSVTSSGNWTASATYPAISDLPAQICVNIYDEHGQEGKIQTGGNNFSPTQDNDNSIQTNNFNPASGAGFCFSPNVVTAQSLVGNVYQCTNNAATTTAVPGATLSASGGSPAGNIPPQTAPLNSGTVSAGNWTLTAGVPTGWQLVASCPGSPASTASAVTTSTVGSGSATATETVLVPSNGTGSGTFYAVPTGSPNLSITKSASVTTVAAGNGFNYTLTVKNNGTVAANDTSVSDPIPAGLTVGTPNPSQGTCSVSGQTVTCSLGTLAPAASATITIPVTATGTVCGPVDNTGQATASNAASATSNTVQVTITCPSFNINLVKSVSATQVNAGTGFTYTLVATNSGAAQATNVVVSDVIPANLGISGTPTSTAGTCSVAGQTVTCDLGTLATGGSATITINVTTSSASCGTALNTGTVTAGSGTTGNSNTVSTAILCPNVTVGVAKTNNASNPGGTNFQQTEVAQAPGEAFTYQAVITNTSTVTEVISSITDTLPGQGTTNVCASLVGTQLAAGASVTCDFPGTAPSSLTASITDTVNVGVYQLGIPANTATGTSTSTVLTSSQNLAGDIYLCSPSGATTAEVSGGTLSASGPTTVASQANPLAPTVVPAGTYTVSAGAPSGYTFVASCSGSPAGTPVATVGTNGSSASETVNVPAGGTGTGIFYVTPVAPHLSVSVVKTNNAADPNGTNFAQTQTAQTTGETFTYQAVISNSDDQPEVISTLTDTLPGQAAQAVCGNLIGTVLNPGQSVTCQFQGTAPANAGASITDTVTTTVTNIPGNPQGTATGTGTSTVLTPPTIVITKTNNAAGTGYGTAETASDTATNVPYQVVVTNNNASPATITSLTDTVGGTTSNICPNLIGSVLAPGQSATCNFTGPVPTTPTTDTAGATYTVNGVPVSGTAQSTVFPPVLGITISPPAPTTAAATPVPTSSLPFTGLPTVKLLLASLGLIVAGLLLVAGDSITSPLRRLRMAHAVSNPGRTHVADPRIAPVVDETLLSKLIASVLRLRQRR